MAVGQLVVLPGLESQGDLVDPNLLTRVAAPIHLRFVEIALVGSVVLVGVASHWLRSRLAVTLALLATASTGFLRLAHLPSLYEAWARVDRVAMLPHDRLIWAEGIAEEAYWLGLGSLLMLVLIAVVAGLQWIAPAPRRRQPQNTPTLNDEAGSTDENPVATAA
jgi:hypothetical protein